MRILRSASIGSMRAWLPSRRSTAHQRGAWVITWSGQVRSGTWTSSCSWNGTYFWVGMPEGCWGWITGLRPSHFVGVQPVQQKLRDEGRPISGPAAAAKEEASSTHAIQRPTDAAARQPRRDVGPRCGTPGHGPSQRSTATVTNRRSLEADPPVEPVGALVAVTDVQHGTVATLLDAVRRRQGDDRPEPLTAHRGVDADAGDLAEALDPDPLPRHRDEAAVAADAEPAAGAGGCSGRTGRVRSRRPGRTMSGESDAVSSTTSRLASGAGWVRSPATYWVAGSRSSSVQPAGAASTSPRRNTATPSRTDELGERRPAVVVEALHAAERRDLVARSASRGRPRR